MVRFIMGILVFGLTLAGNHEIAIALALILLVWCIIEVWKDVRRNRR